jgi:hypothetical protein
MPMVRLLSVEFHHTTSSGACRALAKAPVIPMLEKLRLETCTMKMHDFAEFFGKHSPTCKVLIMGYVQLTNGSMEDLGRLYELLSQAPKIEEYYQGSQFLGAEDEYLTFPPGVWYSDSADDENEDGFVEVFLNDWVHWTGHEEVTEGLSAIARYLLFE